MFYSLQEAAKKLERTEEQVTELVKQGKLREFRDGSNLLFKVDEVDALAGDEGVPAGTEVAEQPTPAPPEQPAEPQQPQDEISLAPETGIPAAENGLTDADTALTGEGVRVLGETDNGYQLTDDSLGETTNAMGETGAPDTAAPEAALEEIEEDVNLDSFGSGSGLLDLSLQADDTSLGGILDEIYTTEGAEDKEPAEPGSAVEMIDEAEQILPDDELAAPQPAPDLPVMVQPYAEPQPDIQSNTLGYLLILPIVMLFYTAIVAISGQRGVMPSIVTATQGVIWYLVIGAVVVAGAVIGAAFWLGGDFNKSPKKPPKPKKQKKGKKKDEPAAPEEELAL